MVERRSEVGEESHKAGVGRGVMYTRGRVMIRDGRRRGWKRCRKDVYIVKGNRGIFNPGGGVGSVIDKVLVEDERKTGAKVMALLFEFLIMVFWQPFTQSTGVISQRVSPKCTSHIISAKT